MRLGWVFCILIGVASAAYSVWYAIYWVDLVAASTGYPIAEAIPTVTAAAVFGLLDFIAVRLRSRIAVEPILLVVVIAGLAAAVPTLLAIWAMSQPEV